MFYWVISFLNTLLSFDICKTRFSVGILALTHSVYMLRFCTDQIYLSQTCKPLTNFITLGVYNYVVLYKPFSLKPQRGLHSITFTNGTGWSVQLAKICKYKHVISQISCETRILQLISVAGILVRHCHRVCPRKINTPNNMKKKTYIHNK